MRIWHTDSFDFPLPEDHRFPLEKYRELRARIEAWSDPAIRWHVPDGTTDEQLSLTHSADYLEQITKGTLSRAAQLRMGLPWSPELVERGRRSCGATLAATRASLGEGVAVSLAGGTHHAYEDRGEGFCLFNDIVVAVRVLRREGVLQRAVVIDLDVHQGNGTARLAANDADLITFSMHAARNYPSPKEESDLDVALADKTDDAAYLEQLDTFLPALLDRTQAQVAFYIAGADPFHDDRLGRLALSKEGLARRDRRVFELCEAQSLPVVVTMGGGYAREIRDTVDIQTETVRQALESWRTRQGE